MHNHNRCRHSSHFASTAASLSGVSTAMTSLSGVSTATTSLVTVNTDREESIFSLVTGDQIDRDAIFHTPVNN